MFVEVEGQYRGADGNVRVTDDRLIFKPHGVPEADTVEIPTSDLSEVRSDIGRESATLQAGGCTFVFDSSGACMTIESALRELMGEKGADPYERPWYDSHGLVLIALAFCFPVGISGWIDRNSLAETGHSRFWHHAGALWVFTLLILLAPVGLYGFMRRIRDEGRTTRHSDYLGAVVATLLTIAIPFLLT